MVGKISAINKKSYFNNINKISCYPVTENLHGVKKLQFYIKKYE